ncbi:MAG TPA: hypothetical protein VFE58_16580 [Tepidisphaeraceae bacterium]|jgi:hypothetical protein|nr:hypothetical protein [Tepidisphaeraceae bacterium]
MTARFRRPLTFLIAFSIIAGLIGCFEIPLGDPEQSKVDTQFTGLWLQKDPSNNQESLVSILPYDSRTYLVTYMAVARDAQKHITPDTETTYKMWLTNVAGTTFATLETKDPSMLLPKAEKYYAYFKISRQADTITAQMVEDKLIKPANLTTPQDLEKFIAQNLNNPDLLGEQTQFHLVDPDHSDDMKAIITAFNHST